MFGHTIHLNVNNEGDEHKTLAGGIMSLFLKLMLLAYVLSIFAKMFTLGDNKESSAQFLIDYHEADDPNYQPMIEYKDTHLVLFMVIKKQLGGSEMS